MPPNDPDLRPIAPVPQAVPPPVAPNQPIQPVNPTPPAGFTPPQPPAPAPTPPAPAGQVVSGGFNPSASVLPGGAPAAVPQAPASPQGFVGSFDTPGVPGQQFSAAPPAAVPVAVSGGRRILKPLLISLAAFVVLGGASAAAYVGVIVPNKPANVLKTALLNSLQEKQVSSSGTISVPSGSFKATFSSASDAGAKAADVKLNVTYTGISFPIEARLVQQNAYFKIGDLSTISSLIGAFSPDAGTAAQNLSKQVSNKWIAVDSTLIDQDPTAKCLLGLSWSLTPADIKLMTNQYQQHPFTTIKTTSSDTVDGQAAEKFVLDISNDGVSKFGDNLKNLSIAKAAQKCPGLSSVSSSAMQLTANKVKTGSTPLTVWVDKSSKHIAQVAYSSKQGSEMVTLHYGHVSIAAPPDSTPVLQFISALQSSLGAGDSGLSQLFGPSADSGTTN